VANSERSFQTELLTHMRMAGYHAFKVTTPFMVGVPDLYVKAPNFPACWIELKYELWDRKKGYIPVNLSNLQRKFLQDENKAGGKAGWALCVRTAVSWDLFAGTSQYVERINVSSPFFIHSRAPGQPWNVQKLMEMLCG
jgi:hypothetical protein